MGEGPNEKKGDRKMDTYELRSELENIKTQIKNADLPENIFNNKELINLAMKMIMIKEMRKMNESLDDIHGKLKPRSHFGM